MGKQKKTRKCGAVKRLISTKDDRVKTTKEKEKEVKRKELLKNADEAQVKEIESTPTHLFFKHNTALGPPYRILLDTNFINFSIQNKLDIFKASMDCLLGKCIPYITDCVIAELEKLGHKYRLALKLMKDPRFEKLKCDHKGTYADDCIINRVRGSRVYIVATCDKDLRRRIRKIPGVPIMYIQSHKYNIERMAEAYGAPR
ncbi:hypothetical protein ABPG74_002853 [Tetrahymena malaccensis]